MRGTARPITRSLFSHFWRPDCEDCPGILRVEDILLNPEQAHDATPRLTWDRDTFPRSWNWWWNDNGM